MKGSLFSNYFLVEGIKFTEDWKKCSEQELENFYSKAKQIFKHFSKRKKPDEADTEDGLIRPIIELLGFQWSRQKSPSRKGRQDVPDFVLFPDEKSKEDFDREPSNRKPWNKGICILEGKRWKRHLDRGDRTDPIDPYIPSNQILRYLSAVDPASNGHIVWGILTNGEIWRLYYHRAPSRAEGYIEFNLSEILEEASLFESVQDKREKFKLFYLLFRKEAFIPTNWRPHRTFLEIALEEGKRWEERVSEDLKEKIFYEIFPDIAKGFLKVAKAKGRNDDSLLQEIYDNTLVLLYRLLFIFYAEDRDLLPIRNNSYRNYSLSKIRDEIAEKIDKKESLSEIASFYWDRIKNLFRIINNGDKSLGIPPYNGGLFDPQKHPFLENYSVPDKFLVPAIDKLSRDYTVTPPKRINYRDLSVRQLGSIYEGLLEFKLKIAETHLGVKKEKGKEIYHPVKNEKEAKIKKGELYLTNDKSERKATGSYYTPDYIVQYIVKNSIEPLIQEKLREFEEWKDLLKTKNKSELQKLIIEFNIPFDPKTYDDRGRIISEKNLNAYRNALLTLKDPAESVLKLKILDPAMGSGHFLVGAVDYLSDRILEILAETSNKSYFGKEIYRSPLIEKLENIRIRILEKAKKEGYIIDETQLEDKNLIKRIILKRCIYGVDVNPLAVELAKVSLWLHTFTIGAPLSFLDHHLKCGNSLIGANPEDFDKIFEKSPLFGSKYAGLMNAVAMIEKLQEITDADISEVEESAKIYDNIVKQLEPYKKLLNVYTAEFFLRPKKKSDLKKYKSPLSLLDGTKGDPLDVISGKVDLTQEEQNLIDTALNLAQNKRFFHWKLEFPEVWYEKGRKKANGGFDVVIGNPPYDIISAKEQNRSKEDVEAEKTFYENNKLFHPSIGQKINYFRLFISLSLKFLTREGGFHSFIVPLGILGDKHSQKLRKFMLKRFNFVSIEAFPHKDNPDLRVFKEAKLPVCVYVGNKAHIANPKAKFKIRIHPYKYIETSTPIIFMSAEEIKVFDPQLLRFPTKPLTTNKEIEIAIKVRSSGIALENFAISKQGEVNVSTHRRFIKHFQKPQKKIGNEYKEVLRGAYIDRYLIHAPKQGGYYYIRWKDFLSSFRGNDSKGFDYRYERIGYQRGAALDNWRRIIATLIPKGSFCADTINYIVNPQKFSLNFILAILNSNLLEWLFRLTSTTNHVNSYEVDSLPLPKIDFTTRDDKKLSILKHKYENDEFVELHEKIQSLPSNSAVLHDFLAYLAEKMIEFNQNKYLLQLFIDGKLEHGSDKMIQLIKLLEKHPHWEDSASEDLKKEIALNILRNCENRIAETDKLIDRIVYHLYGLEEEDIKIIKQFFDNN
ncbi:hypothetical protein G4V39_07605 [Thermosulfuriphilus ammonigenes]|uniref:site-specific DNA-methyltransferase (adenine-specific) n=1 Tax=Thermosulfuriphilus ammonigenes TaxID=1936021 RepID=A0A6G7PWS2_9BACT|nr:Eco57I restriction-modification methylase domain-containing protein [Thermosulfuriphilus ammonigenes]MBA2849866.1 Alw26I/Eco31I/Esp3I family type II restriction m6 adenine DNA methyltransferase [Thermosulfuriphilus ammonigenes]QIJ72139.1 hypothetical protein G4V39_07605 [Thermosulfuriphilus ammonigenes]